MSMPFYYQGMGGGGMNAYSMTQQDSGPSAGFSTSANVSGGSGTGMALLAILGGLVVFYMVTKGIQGSR